MGGVVNCGASCSTIKFDPWKCSMWSVFSKGWQRRQRANRIPFIGWKTSSMRRMYGWGCCPSLMWIVVVVYVKPNLKRQRQTGAHHQASIVLNAQLHGQWLRYDGESSAWIWKRIPLRIYVEHNVKLDRGLLGTWCKGVMLGWWLLLLLLLKEK